MITGALKSKVDSIWITMWSGGIANPLTVIEQLTYLLFIKRLDELHTLKERKAARTGKPIEDPIFTAKQDKLRWSRFKEAAPEQMFETVRDGVFPFIKTLGQNGEADGESSSTYSHHMEDALFMMPTARVLANVVDQLDGIDMADSDTKGDLYEYMLGKIATAGQNGQFRTPRHIIRLMVDMAAPTSRDVICDPACGTAGFLVAASEHLVEHHSYTIYKDAAARRHFNEGTFHGYDFDNTMLRIGSMNMLLHGVENPDIRYKDSLAQTDDDDAEKYSLVLANPPFAGSLDYESTAKDLQQVVKTKKTELLFLALFLRLLQPGGRAAVIVPDGVLFGSSKAHRTLRTILVEEQKLDAIVSHALWRLQTLRRGFHRHPAVHQDQLRRHRPRVVLRYGGGRILARRQAHPTARQERPGGHPRSLAGSNGRGEAHTHRPEFPGVKGRDCRLRLRPLHQPLQGGRVRGGGVRRANGDPRTASGAGRGDREGAYGVGDVTGMRTVSLQQICDIQIGKTPSRSVPEFWGGELPWVTISDFAAGRIVTTTKERITRIGAAKSGSKRIPRGTLLLSFKLSLGKRTFSGCDLFTNEAIAALHVLDHDAADRDYLYWALGSIDYDRLVDRAAKGKTLNKAKLKLLQIPLPPIDEQKRIAGILDAADALQAKRREALAQLDTLLQSTFLDMFGDPVVIRWGGTSPA